MFGYVNYIVFLFLYEININLAGILNTFEIMQIIRINT